MAHRCGRPRLVGVEDALDGGKSILADPIPCGTRGGRTRGVGAASARAACARGWRAARAPSCTRAYARAAMPRAVCAEGGAAARTFEGQPSAALTDLLQRLCEFIIILIRSTSHVIIIIIIIRHPKHFSRPAERARLAATTCCAAAAPWPAQRSKIGGTQPNAPLAEAGHLAIRCVRRSSPCVAGATPAGATAGATPSHREPRSAY